ncbi:HAAAP family serine/threonine permease [Legionella impletisoli]|uniref:Serine transporter n=1 Tax=Legionella impletisoli TaxID=343510 RepID=A0A917JUE4_9GAMM|nr:HAAAP family serine/threonine permease [Legionella impletisoli]GGI85861.1 serine transporter [Legionella impletisoli]
MSSDATIAIPVSTNTIDSDRKHNTTWVLSLYGTAIGAGTLFLPIDAGLNGLLPLMIMTLLAFPMTYFSHQALCRFVLSGSGDHPDITDVVDQHFGQKAGKLLTYLYFFSIFPILLMYSVALTNTTQSFIANQMHLTPPPRALISLLLVIGLMLIIRMGQHMVIKAMSFLVYPFIIVLVMLSLYLVPHWNSAIFHYHPQGHSGIKSLMMSLWLLIPVVIFSFNHSPIISSFAVSQKKRYGHDAAKKSTGILKTTHLLMVITVMFFVFSCVLSLSPENLAEAKEQNISILSYLANHFHTPLIAYIAPIIAFLAIAKSYLGHYLGASEGLAGMINKSLKMRGKTLSNHTLDIGIDLFIILACWVIATINPNILTLIETLGGPIIAVFLFIMPMYAIKMVPSMKQYRKPLANLFTAFIGIIALSAILYGLKHTLGG